MTIFFYFFRLKYKSVTYFRGGFYILFWDTFFFFIFFYRRENFFTGRKRTNQIIGMIGKYTFLIYILHAFILREINKLALEEIIPGLLLGRALKIIRVFMIGFIMAVVIDNTLIKLLQHLFMKLSGWLVSLKAGCYQRT